MKAERKLRVRIRNELGRGLGVTGRANLGSDVVGSADRLMIQIRGGWLLLISRNLCQPGEVVSQKDSCENERSKEQRPHPSTSPTVTTVLKLRTAITRT